MDASIPIIVVAYNRPKALERLLGSLLKASYPGKAGLIISIDGGGGQGEEVKRIATEFNWPFGEKKLIFHQERLGLRRHVLSCGDLSKDHDGVIVLEDDLYVSPEFYHYTLKAHDFYKNDPKIAGISLYSHAYNETAQFPFRPLTDDSDGFFLQYAASLGQFWSREGWNAFRSWYDRLPGQDIPVNLPPNIRLWPESSWKKYFIGYIIQHDLYFAYPRFSLTTHFSDEGTNMRVSENLFQVQLWLDKNTFRFKPFRESYAVYDVFCEIEPERLKRIAPALRDYDMEVDLYGMKSKGDCRHKMFLSSRVCCKPLLSFGREMKPHEMNILAGIPGEYFSLGGKNDFEEKNYFIRLLKCHEKKELSYWYPIREYHFYKNKLLTASDTSRPWLKPGFTSRKAMTMFNYILKYFRKK
jgi:glycosyltransferase involved in cell wall biosynthesis